MGDSAPCGDAVGAWCALADSLTTPSRSSLARPLGAWVLGWRDYARPDNPHYSRWVHGVDGDFVLLIVERVSPPESPSPAEWGWCAHLGDILGPVLRRGRWAEDASAARYAADVWFGDWILGWGEGMRCTGNLCSLHGFAECEPPSFYHRSRTCGYVVVVVDGVGHPVEYPPPADLCATAPPEVPNTPQRGHPPPGEHRVVLYLVGYLEAGGERGWAPAHDDPNHAPERGSVVLVHTTGERMCWRHKFNSGDPKWYCVSYAQRLRDSEAMPKPFRDGGG